MFFQHGDVLLKGVNELPKDSKKIKCDLVVMEGETTGHKHKVLTKTASIFETIYNDTKLRYLVCPEPAIITHEEHGKISFPAGIYEIDRINEYDPFEDVIRKVRD